MAIGLEHLRGPNGEQWTGMSPPQQRSQYPQQKKSQAPQSPFGPQQSVQTSMGNFPTLQAYQQQQDAFVQQHLKNQAQYNQGLQSGQSPQRVPLMDAWKQAGENIQSGQYQGNPFQTGNVDAIMGMFNQYGIQAPQGFRDQLLQNLGQQSAPPMYQPQWDYYKDPREMSPGGFIQPGPSQPPQPAMGYQGVPTRTLEPTDGSYAPVAPPMGYPGGPMPPMAPGYGGRIGLPPGSMVTMDFRDRDGDMIDDRDQPGPGQSPTAVYGQPPQAPAAPNPSDPWSYPLRPGHTRGPSGEQIMTREAREAEIRRMEQESGRTYVRPKAGVTNGGWLPPARQNPGSSISLNPEQAAGMRQYMESRQASRAQPTPPRTQGTPYRGRRR